MREEAQESEEAETDQGLALGIELIVVLGASLDFNRNNREDKHWDRLEGR